MLQLTTIELPSTVSLSVLIDRASAALANARSHAEFLEARDMASLAFHAAKATGRLARAKEAHDELLTAAHRVQADALAIEASAKQRLSEEYGRAQERGEVQKAGGDRVSIVPVGNNAPTVRDLGLTRKDIHEGRRIGVAEMADPGFVRRTLNDALGRGEEPTKALLRKAVVAAASRALRSGGGRSAGTRNPLYMKPTAQNTAVSVVSSCLTSLLEAASDYPPEIYLIEQSSDASRQSFIDRARRTRDLLRRILEVADA